MSDPKMEQLAINTIRTLSMDAVQAAKSGHPGTPMALAPLVYTIWNRTMRFDPQDPIWPNRDRFSVKLLEEEQELYVLAESQDRVNKERAMRRRQLKGLWHRLKKLQGMKLQRDALLKKLGGPCLSIRSERAGSTRRRHLKRPDEPLSGAKTNCARRANAKALACCAATSRPDEPPKNSGSFTSH
jgi:hypothetical protein